MIQEALPNLPPKDGQVRKSKSYSPEIDSAEETPKSSTLIEFPGTNRAVPEWRKQLSQRVREVQERKAREAAEELAAAQEAGLVSCALPSGQLELVPDLENPVINPIVTKALERLERARRPEYSASYGAAAAVAPALEPEVDAVVSTELSAPPVEPKHKLTVVAPAPAILEPSETATDEEPALDVIAPVVEASAASESLAVASAETESIVLEPELEIETEIQAPSTNGRKPIRVISDNDIALSYLETCLSVPALSSDSRTDIPGLTRRFLSGMFDLILIALMVSPAAAALQYSGANWAEPRIIGIMGGITVATMFAYLTMCIAMTGRTLAMRMFKMRTIDLRTGLIPTGAQSVTRAITYVFSFALLGLGLAYALIDPDKRAVHDRISKTIVVRV